MLLGASPQTTAGGAGGAGGSGATLAECGSGATGGAGGTRSCRSHRATLASRGIDGSAGKLSAKTVSEAVDSGVSTMPPPRMIARGEVSELAIVSATLLDAVKAMPPVTNAATSAMPALPRRPFTGPATMRRNRVLSVVVAPIAHAASGTRPIADLNKADP